MANGKEQLVRQYTIEDIYTFLVEQLGVRRSKLTPDIRLEDDLGVDGADVWELAEAFGRRFSVDMTGFLWYFHSGDEAAFNFGGLFFAPPYKRVTPIPLTPKLLLEGANTGTWPVQYPPHTLPAKRYDMVINGVIFCASFLALLVIVVKKLVTFFSAL